MGIALTFVFSFVVGMVEKKKADDPIQYLEHPVSYEEKSSATFKIIDVPFPDAALAQEEVFESVFLGNIVLLKGKDFYNGQAVTIDNPQRIGSFSYESRGGLPMTVPVVEGKTHSEGKSTAVKKNTTSVQKKKDPIHHLERPLPYEGKKTTSFKVFKVLDGHALAREESDRFEDHVSYYGNTVLLTGSDFYDGMVVTMKDPQRIGTYQYDGKNVPVIEGEK